MPVTQGSFRKLSQSELLSNKQVTQLSNPVFLHYYLGWTSLDPRSTQRMWPRISNKRTVEAKLSQCFVNKYATKAFESGGRDPYILYLDTRCEYSASPTARSTPREGDAGTQEKGGRGGPTQTTNPDTLVVMPATQTVHRLKCLYYNRRRSAPQLRRCKTIAQTK